MKVLTAPNVLLLVSLSCLVLAISLACGSLGKSVKWNLYDSETNYGSGFVMFKIYAYQTLYTSYDIWSGSHDTQHAQAYNIIIDESWKELARQLIMASAGTGGLSLAVLLNFSLIPYLKRKTIILNIARNISSVLSVAAGSTLGYTLHYYKSRYSLNLCPVFHDPSANYPDEDNLSTGFYMVATASVSLFISATLNTINVVLLMKAAKTAVKPIVSNI